MQRADQRITVSWRAQDTGPWRAPYKKPKAHAGPRRLWRGLACLRLQIKLAVGKLPAAQLNRSAGWHLTSTDLSQRRPARPAPSTIDQLIDQAIKLLLREQGLIN